jgi:predicted nucleic acid-binding protein
MTKPVFFDTDCLSSFLWTNTENLLGMCLGSSLYVPRQVYGELSKVPKLKSKIDAMIAGRLVELIDIPCDTEADLLYRKLTMSTYDSPFPLIGKGEASAIVLARMHDGIVASNNYADTAAYVKQYGLTQIATEHILIESVERDLIDFSRAETIWVEMIARKRRLPYSTFRECWLNRKGGI